LVDALDRGAASPPTRCATGAAERTRRDAILLAPLIRRSAASAAPSEDGEVALEKLFMWAEIDADSSPAFRVMLNL
jgi:hypothetical protein